MDKKRPTFSNLKIKPKNELEVIHYGDIDIEVVKYLHSEDKNIFIDMTIQRATRNGIIYPFLINVYFNLHLIYLYTNITFTEKQRENEFYLYDSFVESGLLNKVYEAIPQSELNTLNKAIDDTIDTIRKHQRSFEHIGEVIKNATNDLPEKMEQTVALLNSVKPENFQMAQEFVALAKDSNNGQMPKE